MIRVVDMSVFFYSHEFSDDLLDRIAKGIVPLDCTQIQKFVKIEDDIFGEKFSLLIADARAIIFQILDSIQQIISER